MTSACVPGQFMQRPQPVIEPLLGPGDPAPFERVVRDSRRPVIVVCDHASRRIPESLGSLGVPDKVLDEHIAWDIGAAGVAHRLARDLGASEVVAGYSRLVVDLNRSLRDRSAIPEISDGVLVPGNLGLEETHRELRIGSIYLPYHNAIDQLVRQVSTPETQPVFIAVHSFTPLVSRLARPWHIGVLWDKDSRVAVRLLASLRRHDDICVGDNEPYSGRHAADYTIDHHAEAQGLAHAAIEVRQDLIDTEAGQQRWADRLADVLGPLLESEDLFLPTLRSRA
jgi:predicted N-formylglutamate amidohydrolase